MDRIYNRPLSNSRVKLRLGPNIKKDVILPASLKEGDARFKLIQKKRVTITDARDRLSEIAKQKDARQKINALKVIKSSHSKESTNGLQKKTILTVGGGIQRTLNKNIAKTRLPNIELNKNYMSTKKAGTSKFQEIKTSLPSKTSLNSGLLTRTVNSDVIDQGAFPKRVTAAKNETRVSTERFHPLPNNPNLVTIRNEKLFQSQKNADTLRSAKPQLKAQRYFTPTQNPATSQSHSIFQRPVPKQSLNRNLKDDNQWNPKRMLLPIGQEMQPTRLKITAVNSFRDCNPSVEENYDGKHFDTQPALKVFKRPYEEYNEYLHSPQKKQAVLSSRIISRLDQPHPPTHPRYKVVVTNLHPVVTYEDVEELFSNIGTLKSARIVRQGIAEVVFQNEDDARRSVEVYHNRQLDGQAMNVTLVGKKSFTSSSCYSPPVLLSNSPPRTTSKTSPSLASSHHPVDKAAHSTKSVLRTAGGSSYRMYDSTASTASTKRSQRIAVAPDVSAIHHALFSGRLGNQDSDLQVYIKLPKQPLRGGK